MIRSVAWYSLKRMEWEEEEAVGVGGAGAEELGDRKSPQGRPCLKFQWQIRRVSKGGKWHGREKTFPTEVLGGEDSMELVQNQKELVWLEWTHEGRSGKGWGWGGQQGRALNIVLQGLETMDRFQGRERRHQLALARWWVLWRQAVDTGRPTTGRLLMSRCHHNNCKHLPCAKILP